MIPPRRVHPLVGVDDFRLGMSRPELWALTDSTVLAAFRGGATDRDDHFQSRGVTACYQGGRAAEFTVFPRMGGGRVLSIFVLGEDVARFGRPDVAALLDLHGVAWQGGVEHVEAPALGLTFWLRQDADEPEVLEFVRVGAAR